jgi:hypothetical protein
LNDNDIKRIITESAKASNGIITPQQLHEWILDQYTVKCIECEGTGSYMNKYEEHKECFACEGLGVIPRKKVIQVKNCMNCELRLPDNDPPCSLKNRVTNPHTHVCPGYLPDKSIAQHE